jgi:hypothetical protein
MGQEVKKPSNKKKYESIMNYNPFLANLSQPQIDKMGLGVSNSTNQVHAPVFNTSALKKSNVA